MGQALGARATNVLTPALSKFNASIVERGNGVFLYGPEGKKYLDFASGIAVTNLGHCHPAIVSAAREQMEKLIHACIHVSWYSAYIELAEKLAEISPEHSMMLFSNSGTEAVEAALKLARYVQEKPGIIAFQGSFHGRTLGAASVSGKAALRRRYGPLVPSIYHAPYPWCFHCSYGQERETCHLECYSFLERLLYTVIHPDETAAILIEPILGEGGYYIAPSEFMMKLRELCDRHGILLMVDEIQSGMGRTGKMFAWQHIDGFMPDVIILAKALGSGFPIGAVLGRPTIMSKWNQGAHGSTFGGNPVCCAAALATIHTLEDEGLLTNAAELGEYLLDQLSELRSSHSQIADVRGSGLMLALEFANSDGSPDQEGLKRVIAEAESSGLIVIGGGIYGNVLRIIPPLVLTREQADEGLSILSEVMKRVFI